MSTPAAALPRRFGRFELQADERRLLVDGAPAALGGRAFDLLLALAERPGQLVGKHVLMDLVWPGLVVQENNLAAQMSTLRTVVATPPLSVLSTSTMPVGITTCEVSESDGPMATVTNRSPGAATIPLGSVM